MKMLRTGIMMMLLILWVMSGCAALPQEGQVDTQERQVDNIDLPFVDDPAVMGTWKGVDLVETIEQFDPAKKQTEGALSITRMTFYKDGALSQTNWTWTKGVIINHNDQVAGEYLIKEIDGATYLFFELKTGDYVFRRMAPWYYVLKKA